MEIRFNTISKDVEGVLETIDKNNRKFFVETAILHYIKYLETEDAIDLFYNSRNPKNYNQSKYNGTKKSKVYEKDEHKIYKKTNEIDNISLGVHGW